MRSDSQSSFSPFTFGSKSGASNPLPIELLDFNAILQGPNVLLKWTTASEINSDYFTIERSRDAEFWDEVSEIPGAGFSTEIRYYEDLDFNPYPGISYYRLKQTDFDGTFEYSDIRVVDMNVGEDSKISIFPNPTDGMLTIIANGDELKDFRVSTMLGQDLTSLVQLIESAATEHRLDLSQLKPGIYILRLNSVAVKVYKK